MSRQVIISGTGCCLVDQIYSGIDFSSASFLPYLSKKRGDGGLVPGNLVFSEDFEDFTDSNLRKCLEKITGGKDPGKLNIGGPSIVPLIHAAQLHGGSDARILFYGVTGKDEEGRYLRNNLRKTPVQIENLVESMGSTPGTVVLSDPNFNQGHGERIFINSIGSAWEYRVESLDNEFFKSDIVVFGATALVPNIHKGLTDLLIKAKSEGCKTVVNTVFDFLSEKERPGKRWMLGQGDESYKYIDLLITDREEALHLSGKSSIVDSVSWFMEKQLSSLIITNGTEEITALSDGRLFTEHEFLNMPVSEGIVNELHGSNQGDTTGCGDNFVGGILASMAWQMKKGKGVLDLREACAWGIVSGGFCCFYIGGTYLEQFQGEKLKRLNPYFKKYIQQLNDRT